MKHGKLLMIYCVNCAISWTPRTQTTGEGRQLHHLINRSIPAGAKQNYTYPATPHRRHPPHRRRHIRRARYRNTPTHTHRQHRQHHRQRCTIHDDDCIGWIRAGQGGNRQHRAGTDRYTQGHSERLAALLFWTGHSPSYRCGSFYPIR